MRDAALWFALNCLPIWIIVFYVAAVVAGIIHLRCQFQRQALSANELLLWVLFVVFVPFAGFFAVILLHSRDKPKRE